MSWKDQRGARAALPGALLAAPGGGEPVEKGLQLDRQRVLLHGDVPAMGPESVDEAIGPGGRRRGVPEALLDRGPLVGAQRGQGHPGRDRQPAEPSRPLDDEGLARPPAHEVDVAAVGTCVPVSTPTCAHASPTALASVEPAPYSVAAAVRVACAYVWNWASGGTTRLVLTWSQILPALAQAPPPMPV